MDPERRGNRQAEYLRVSLALKDLKKLGLSLIDSSEPRSTDSMLVEKAIEYLLERQVKLNPH